MSEQWKEASQISASEIGEYVYCNRQWWLKRVEGVRPAKRAQERMESGVRYHDEHWQLVQKAARNDKLIYVFIAAAVSVVMLFFLLTLGG